MATTATLKKLLGEAGALLDQSGGYTGKRLYDVLLELVSGSQGSLDAYQATIATADIAGKLINRASVLTGLRIAAATTGDGNTTTVQVHVNGSSVGALSIINTEADAIKKAVALSVELAAGDIVEIVVSAAATNAAGLTASAIITPSVTVE